MADVTAKLALPPPKGERVALQFARFLGLFVSALGALVLVGWRMDIHALVQPLPEFAAMQPNAALGMVIAGLGLFCFTFDMLRPVGRSLGFALALLGLAILSQDVFGWDFDIDAALLPAGATASEVAQIPPGMAFSLLLFGFALFTARDGRFASGFSQLLAITMLAQVLLMLAGHAYGVAMAYYPFPFSEISFHGAVATFLLALGLLLATPDYGIAGAILEQSPAGEMLRRLLPGILVLPLIIGWFAHQAEVQTYYDSAATLALFAVASIVVLAAFAWTTIGAVRRADRDRNEALVELRGQREWLSTTLGSIGDGVIATDPNGSVLILNKIAEDMTGWTLAEARGRPIWEVFRVIDETSRKPVDDPALKALRERSMTRLEAGALLKTRDGREIPVEDSGAPILGSDGSLAGAVLIFRDVTERRRAAERQTMLVGELNHRVKNALAIVQSLVQASLRQATTKPAQAMAQTLSDRLQALHRAHDLLLQSQWSGASLKQMVERELEPYQRDDGQRITIKGPDVLLPPQCTSIMAMTLHELATNAVKYGALSQNEGQLAVNWKMMRGGRLLLTWEERATILNPKRSSGFGMQLIDKGIRHNLGGETKVDFRSTGLYVELNVPLDQSPEGRARQAPPTTAQAS